MAIDLTQRRQPTAPLAVRGCVRSQRGRNPATPVMALRNSVAHAPSVRINSFQQNSPAFAAREDERRTQ